MSSIFGEDRSLLNRLAIISLRLLIIAAFAILAGLAIDRLRLIVLPALLALVLGSALLPIKRRLRDRGLPDAAAALVLVGGAAVAIIGIAALTAQTIADDYGEFTDQLETGLTELGNQAIETFGISQEQVDDAIDSVVATVRGNAPTLAGGVFRGVLRLFELLAGAVLLIILLFWVLKDGDRLHRATARRLHGAQRRAFLQLSSRLTLTLGHYLRGAIIVALIDAVLIGIGLFALGIPLALPLAVFTFFAAFVPIAGALVSGAAAILVALATDGLVDAVIVGLLVLAVQQLEGNVLQPIIVGRAVSLHPAIIIAAVAAGGALWGILGAVVAVPFTATGVVVIDYFTARDRARRGSERRPAPDPPPT